MASVVNVTSIAGPVEAVFDLVTSARFWPEWHPASHAVFGVIQRPYQLGDRIHERVHFAGVEAVVTWEVAEYTRPRRVVLQSLATSTRITYSLEPQASANQFQRELEYDEARFQQLVPRAGDIGRLMHAQSEEGLRRLKELVERILNEERVVPSVVPPA